MDINKSSFTKAFSLIELIIVIAIIAILAAVAAPTYIKYRVQAKVATMVSAAQVAELEVQNDYFNQDFTLTGITYSAGSQPFLVPPTDIISSMSVSNGIITVVGNPDELESYAITLTFTPTVVDQAFSWVCSSSSTYWDYVPTECQN